MQQPTTSQQLVSILEAWLPEPLRRSTDRRPIMLVYTVCLFAAVTMALYTVALIGGATAGATHFVAATLLATLALSLRILHITGSITGAVNLVLGVVFSGSLAYLLLAGGRHNPLTTILLVEGLLAFYFLDRHWRTLWLALVTGGYVVLTLAEVYGDAPLVFPIPDTAAVWVVLQCWLLLQALGVVAVIDRSREIAVAAASRGKAHTRNLDLKVEELRAGLRNAREQAALADAEAKARIEAATTAEAHAQETEQRQEQERRALLDELSREIRTPLNAVLGTLQILTTTRLDPDQRRLVDTSVASAEGLLAYVADRTTYESLETAGTLEVERVGFDVRELLDELVHSRQSLALAVGLSWELSIDPHLPDLIEGDPTQIRQVLYTLVDNAFRSTTSGGVIVDVRIQGRSVRFGISDTGVGMPPDTLEEVFEVQPGGVTAGHPGLAIARRIVDAMGGEIGVRSTEDIGSTFWFIIPHLRATQAFSQLNSIARTRQEVPPGLRVLLVEDNLVNRMIAERMLAIFEAKVDVAGDGVEAVQQWRRTDYDVILMDCRMPRMDGLEATRQIRSLEDAHERVPIIAITADAQADRREACLEAGMDDHITKPFRMDDLRIALARSAKEMGFHLEAAAS